MGKPNADTVIETFRYMFIELMELGLGIPMELEVEHHLMSNFDFLDQLFPFVRFCNSPTEKRAEHNIKSLKWGTAKQNGHTRGRWYAKHEAYRSIRTKVDGDYPEPEYDLRTVIADDLSDIEKHNNELHPDQKNFPGMTRRDVLIKCKNPNCQKIEPKTLFRYIGNETASGCTVFPQVNFKGRSFQLIAGVTLVNDFLQPFKHGVANHRIERVCISGWLIAAVLELGIAKDILDKFSIGVHFDTVFFQVFTNPIPRRRTGCAWLETGIKIVRHVFALNHASNISH